MISYVGCSSSQINYQAFVITSKFRDQEGAKCTPSIPSKMGLQRKVVISLEESFQRILPSDIDMEISPVHESSHLDEQRKEVRESSVDLFEKPIEMVHDCSGFDTPHHCLESSIYEEATKH